MYDSLDLLKSCTNPVENSLISLTPLALSITPYVSSVITKDKNLILVILLTDWHRPYVKFAKFSSNVLICFKTPSSLHVVFDWP